MVTCATIVLGLHLATYHFDRDRKYEEFNPGAYATCDEYEAGLYRNSEGKFSTHVGYTVRNAIGPIDLTFGMVTGYKRGPILPLFIPSVKLGDVRIHLLIPIEKRGGGLHMSYEF